MIACGYIGRGDGRVVAAGRVALVQPAGVHGLGVCTDAGWRRAGTVAPAGAREEIAQAAGNGAECTGAAGARSVAGSVAAGRDAMFPDWPYPARWRGCPAVFLVPERRRPRERRRHGALPWRRGHQRGHGARAERRRCAGVRHHPYPRCAPRSEGRHADAYRRARSRPRHSFFAGHVAPGHGLERRAGQARRPAQSARYRTGTGKLQTRADRRG